MADTLRLDQVRARLAAALQGVTVTGGTLHEAHCPYDDLPQGLSDLQAHLAFGVVVGPTTGYGSERQRPPQPWLVQSPITVRLVHRMRRDHAAVVDYDTMLQVEAEAVIAALAISGADGLALTYTGTSLRQAGSTPIDLYLVQLDFRAVHSIPTA